jgi:hypothetical protein
MCLWASRASNIAWQNTQIISRTPLDFICIGTLQRQVEQMIRETACSTIPFWAEWHVRLLDLNVVGTAQRFGRYGGLFMTKQMSRDRVSLRNFQACDEFQRDANAAVCAHASSEQLFRQPGGLLRSYRNHVSGYIQLLRHIAGNSHYKAMPHPVPKSHSTLRRRYSTLTQVCSYRRSSVQSNIEKRLAPHVGHLYTLILTDIIKRWQQLKGKQAILCTGTDEHGLKVCF